jgi:hypothetical protein
MFGHSVLGPERQAERYRYQERLGVDLAVTYNVLEYRVAAGARLYRTCRGRCTFTWPTVWRESADKAKS